MHDLPQLYQKPTAEALLEALHLLSWDPPALTVTARKHRTSPHVDEQGVPVYLTLIISSSLRWIPSDDLREQIWSAASARLSERSGRNAMPSMTRTFHVADDLAIHLHEPSLTGDNLGLKTWTSSLLLARRLPQLRPSVAQDCTRVLELGAGTGLVGIAAACLWQMDAILTDLPGIVPNLQQNVEQNLPLIQRKGGTASARALDWADVADTPQHQGEKFLVVLAADPIYSPDHPALVVTTVRRWIRDVPEARFIAEIPLRDGFDQERAAFREELRSQSFQLVDQGIEKGYEDWQGKDGEQAEVECWWSVWRPVV